MQDTKEHVRRGPTGGRGVGRLQRGKGIYLQSQHCQSRTLATPLRTFLQFPDYQTLLLKTNPVTPRTASSINICHLTSSLLVATGTCDDVRMLNISIEFVGKYLFSLFQISI